MQKRKKGVEGVWKLDTSAWQSTHTHTYKGTQRSQTVAHSLPPSSLMCIYMKISWCLPFQHWAHSGGTHWQVNIAWIGNAKEQSCKKESKKRLFYWAAVHSSERNQQTCRQRCNNKLQSRFYMMHNIFLQFKTNKLPWGEINWNEATAQFHNRKQYSLRFSAASGEAAGDFK